MKKLSLKENNTADLPSPATLLFRKLSPSKQEKIFQAAVQEFASKGYRSASMNRLVKDAGISKGSLFLYFRTKRDLFDGVVEIAASKVKDYLKTVRDDTTNLLFFDRLELILRSGFDFIDRHPLLARIYFHLLQSGEAPFGSERIAMLRQQAEKFLSELIVTGIEREELKTGLDVPRLAFLINSLLETLLRAYYTDFLAPGLGLYRGNSQQLDQWVRTTLHLVREGIGNAAPESENPAKE